MENDPAPPAVSASAGLAAPSRLSRDATRLRELSPTQWRAGLAAWLGWLFDGLDAYLYVLVAAPFVAQLLGSPSPADPRVAWYASWIQAAFLLGWAVGGVAFGRLGDRLGRSRTMSLTILTYAVCTGLSALSQAWWHLLIFRFLAALGIGGEWAAGSALVAETWPRRWRPWVGAVLQSAYNCGMLLATLTLYILPSDPRHVFLVGALPALAVFWIRRAVPETDEWHAARAGAGLEAPGLADLFRGPVRRTTILTILLCSMALSITWAFQFWYPQHLRGLPEVAAWPPGRQARYVSLASTLAILAALPGNFLGSWLARTLGYRGAFALMFLGGLAATFGAFGRPRDHASILWWACGTSFFTGGVFGLFPLYLPPLFPTLLRTSGAGLCYNIGRVVAAAGTVVFGLFARVDDYRAVLLGVGCLCLPATLIALVIPEPKDDTPAADR